MHTYRKRDSAIMRLSLSCSALCLVFSAASRQSCAFAPSHTSMSKKYNAASSNCRPAITGSTTPTAYAPMTTTRKATALHAKKGKKKKSKSKQNQKKSGMEWATNFSLKPYESTALRELASTAAASFEGRTGQPLSDALRGVADIPKALWNADVAVVVVGTKEIGGGDTNVAEDEEEAAESVAGDEHGEGTCTTNANASDAWIVKYANVAALETVGLKPTEYVRFISPSGPNAAEITTDNPVIIDIPSQMNGDKKYESGYKKKIIRSVSSDENGEDQSISIVDAHRWALEKSMLIDGKFVTNKIGVAYAWEKWMRGESTLCSPGGKEELVLNADQLEEKVAEQAGAIRTLKEEHGLKNSDPEVKEAVAKLLELKEMLATVSG